MRPNSSIPVTARGLLRSWQQAPGGALCEDETVDTKAGEIQAGNEE